MEPWADFTILVLEVSCEAAFCAAIANSKNSGNNTLFLTLPGGGAFGNQDEWIIRAIDRPVQLYLHNELDVLIVSFSGPRP